MSDVCSSSNSASSSPDTEPKISDVFRNIKTEDLHDYSLKMIDALNNDGLPHEVPTLFHQTKDTGRVPVVIYHTLIIDRFGNAGHTRDAFSAYVRMLSQGVSPTSFTYTVLVNALAANPNFFGLAKKYLLEMVGQGMKPTPATYTAVLEGFSADNKVEEGMEFLNQMKGMGFVLDKKAVKDLLKKKNRRVVKAVNTILSGSNGDNGRHSKGTKDRYRHPLDNERVRTLWEADQQLPEEMEEIVNMFSMNDLANYAVNMFDVLSLECLPHPRLQMAQAFHTQVIEAYANAGRTNDALYSFIRMQISPVASYAGAPVAAPHARTYAVLIKGLAADPEYLGHAQKYLMEMMEKGFKPNAETYTVVFEGFAVANKVEEAKEFLEALKGKEFVADEEAVREELKGKSEPVVASVISILFGN